MDHYLWLVLQITLRGIIVHTFYVYLQELLDKLVFKSFTQAAIFASVTVPTYFTCIYMYSILASSLRSIIIN